jgi:hypothetical protein
MFPTTCMAAGESGQYDIAHMHSGRWRTLSRHDRSGLEDGNHLWLGERTGVEMYL